MDLREHNPDDLVEVLRVLVAGITSQHRTAIPVQVVQDTEDGHVSMIQPRVQRKVVDPDDGTVTYLDHPPYPDAVIHHLGGGGVSKTFPNKAGDQGLAIFSDRPVDGPFQADGNHPPIDDRVHSFSDASYLPGWRSEPSMLKAVSKDSAQTRSDDGHHTSDLHPQNGITHKSVDPSTPVASDEFSPFADATKFFAHLLHPTNGILGQATDGGTTHSHGVDHSQGAWMSAGNLSTVVRAHPVIGALLSALGGQHLVHADPNAGVTVSSSKQVQIASQGALSISAPPGMLGLSGLAGGSIAAAALAAGAASSNVGPVGGDLSGSLPNPRIASGAASRNVGSLGGALTGTLPNPGLAPGVASASVGSLGGALSGSLPNPGLASGAAAANIGNLQGDLSGYLPNASVTGLRNVNLSNYPQCANDQGAAAVGVPTGGLYLNPTISQGSTVLCVRQQA